MKKIYFIPGTLIVIIIVFLILGFIYPFSFFNVTHKVSVTSSHYVVQGHQKEINKFHLLQKKAYLNKDTRTLIEETKQYLTQKWLLQKHYKFSYNDIVAQKQLTKNLLFDVDSYRKQNRRSLSQSANEYLLNFRNNLSEVVQNSNIILNTHMLKRNTLRTLIFNLRDSYENTASSVNLFLKQIERS
ncbi:MAG: hypothetical protein ABF651_05675 [Sporolactobacillus sp.]